MNCERLSQLAEYCTAITTSARQPSKDLQEEYWRSINLVNKTWEMRNTYRTCNTQTYNYLQKLKV